MSVAECQTNYKLLFYSWQAAKEICVAVLHYHFSYDHTVCFYLNWIHTDALYNVVVVCDFAQIVRLANILELLYFVTFATLYN